MSESMQVAPTEARLMEMVFPDHTNHHGTCSAARRWRGWTRRRSSSPRALAAHGGDRAFGTRRISLPILQGMLREVIARCSAWATAR